MTGLVVGIGQSLVAQGLRGPGLVRRGVIRPGRWIPATTLGMAVGLPIGAAAAGYGTSLADLALMGVLTGVPLGIAQALALPPAVRWRWLWAVTTPVLWALGWTVTTLVGVDVEAQYTIFGSTGAVVFSALSGLVLLALLRRAES